MKICRIATLLILSSFILTGCFFFTPFEAKEYPEYPFELNVFYDGRCEGSIQVFGESIPIVGTLSYSDYLMEDDTGYTFASDRMYYLRCRIQFDPDDSVSIIDSIEMRMYFDRYYENLFEEYVSKQNQKIISGPRIFDAVALQLEDQALEMQLGKYKPGILDGKRVESLFQFESHPSLPIRTATVAYTGVVQRKVPKPFAARFSCGRPLFHSKNGSAAISAIADYSPDAVYLVLKGNFVIGGSKCL